MQNRYVGDIGDYVKLAILRELAPGRSLGVVWWLFPNEDHNADGSHRKYLEQHTEWKRFDPGLFEALLEINKQNELDVSALEKASGFRNAVFVSDPVPCEIRPFTQRPTERNRWLGKIKERLKDCDLVFLDPDNGIASERLKLTQRCAGKSVTIGDIKALQDNNRAMVVYHHQTHFKGGHSSEIHLLSERLKESGIHVSGALRAKPWSPRLFFILNGDRELHDRAKSIAEKWGSLISWHPDLTNRW